MPSRKNRHRARRLCTCTSYGCQNNIFVNSVTRTQLRGRLIGEKEYQSHQTADIRRGYLASHANPSDPSLQAPQQEAEVLSASASFLSTLSSGGDRIHSSNASYRAEKALDDILRLNAAFLSGRRTDLHVDGLIFSSHPTHSDPTSQDLVLQTDVISNAPILEYEHWVFDTLGRVDRVVTGGEGDTEMARSGLINTIEAEWDRVQGLKLHAWRQQYQAKRADEPAFVSRLNPQRVLHIDTAAHFRLPILHAEPIVTAVFILVAIMHLISGLSLTDCSFLLESIRLIIELSMEFVGSFSKRGKHVTDSIPRDPRSILKGLRLSPPTNAYICCPKCFACYPDGGPESYPERCTFTSTPSSTPCGRILRKTRTIRGKVHTLPTRRYLYHDLKEWIGELLCREGMETLLDSVLTDSPIDSSSVNDIWDSEELRNFKGPDGTAFFSSGSKGRLAFSLCMDGFNPLQNKQAGKKVSTGAMYMICLNLPPQIRYRVENMFLVGIIPGPNEPSMEQINHLLKPLVDDLLDLWEPGISYSKTPNHPEGRTIRGAFVLLVSDLLAARQMAGFAGHTSLIFCSYCKLSLRDINNLDIASWGTRTYEEHMRHARAWRDASSETERDHIYTAHGVRWSELLRLPYWDPIRYTVIDSMHALFLGNLKRHCRTVWGMDVQFEDGDGTIGDPVLINVQDAEVREGFYVLRTATRKKVEGLKLKVLKCLVQDCHLRAEGRKKKPYIHVLINYRQQKGWFDENDCLILPPSSQELLEMECEGKSDQADLAVAEEYYQFAPNEKAFQDLYKTVLVALCVKKFSRTKSEFNRLNKAQLAQELIGKRMQEGLANESGQLLVQNLERFNDARKVNGKRKKACVLGKDRLQQVHNDMERTILPSWIAHAPRDIGSGKHGKVSADQWRTFCTINLVITLGILWGTLPHESREYCLYTNFMDLVSATKIATMRKMTLRRIDEFSFHMIRYLQELLVLFPGIGLSPNNHISVHLTSFFRRFGPTHAWRCFAFERWNYLLQQINTNMHFGEMEKTMYEQLCMGQKLRSIIHSRALTPILKRLVSAYDRAFGRDIRGTFLNDMLAFEDEANVVSSSLGVQKIRLPVATWSLLTNLGNYSQWVTSHGKVDLARGVSYDAALGSRDSYVIVGEGVPDHWEAAQITMLFTAYSARSKGIKEPEETFAVVQKFKSLSPEDARHDPYRRFAIAGGRLYYHAVENEVSLVKFSEILYHFALTPVSLPNINAACIHALPLDRD